MWDKRGKRTARSVTPFGTQKPRPVTASGMQNSSAGGDVRGARELEEVNEVNEVKNESGGVAAFFDLDGTLVSLPSLEQRLFRTLRYRQEIRTKNYFLWLKEAVRLAPRGFSAILQANKMYLRGVEIFDERDERD